MSSPKLFFKFTNKSLFMISFLNFSMSFFLCCSHLEEGVFFAFSVDSISTNFLMSNHSSVFLQSSNSRITSSRRSSGKLVHKSKSSKYCFSIPSFGNGRYVILFKVRNARCLSMFRSSCLFCSCCCSYSITLITLPTTVSYSTSQTSFLYHSHFSLSQNR